MRINKYIAASGLCSRRKAEEYLNEGRVSVNGQIASIATVLSEGDIVKVDGQIVAPKEEFEVLLFNKPIGITCTTERHIKGNIIDYINYPVRIFPIGRLDKDSSGLILLTNDGDLVNQCLRKENGHEKEYIVEVDKIIDEQFLANMAKGVRIYNPVTEHYVKTLPCKLTKINDHKFLIILTQGYNRQIRRMCQAFKYHVTSLKRVRFMHLKLDVKEGSYRLLNPQEIAKLRMVANHNMEKSENHD